VSASDVTAVPEDQRLYLVVYFDNVYLKPFSRERAASAVRRFLADRLVPDDQVMVVTFDRTLHVRQPFTRDMRTVHDALDELEKLTGFAVQAEAERRRVIQLLDSAKSFQEAEPFVDFYAKQVFNDLERSIEGLQELVAPLAGLPGRKALLYVSDGLPMEAGADLFHLLDLRFGDSSAGRMLAKRYSARSRFRELISSANANRVTFYTLDAAGLRTYSYMDVANATAQGGAMIDQIHFSNLQNSLIYMAQETGGKVIMNTNDFTDGLEQVGDDLSSYYSLGFSSGSTESGRYHNIQVRVKGDKANKWTVRHREGYRDKPISTRMSEGTLAALHYGVQSNPLDVRIEVGEMQPQEKGRRYLVPLSVEIPIGSLNFLPQSEFQRGRIRLYVAALDDEGGISPVQDVPVPIDIPTADFEYAKTQMYKYAMTLQMRSGRQVVAVGVHDEIGAVSGFVTRGLSVGGR
jgi:VWFA-related protein